MRAKWRNELAIAGGDVSRPAFGRRKKGWRDLDLVVDLADEPLSKRWWCGVATLTALCALVAILAPAPFEPLPAAGAHIGSAEAEQFRDLSVKPIAEGSTTGVRMAANGLVRPLSAAPDRPFVELFARLGEGDSIERLLVRSGASYAEAGEAARVISSAVPGIIAGTSIAMRLGRRTASGVRPIERIAFRHGIDLNVVVTAASEGLEVATSRLAVDNRPLRVRGRVGDGLYWALRSSGVSPQAAGEYLRAIGSHLDVGGELGPDDRFDLVIANRRAATGESQEGPLLYAAIDRSAGSDLRLVKWTVGGKTDWVNANGAGRQVASTIWPVAGRITSGFGLRVHPILRFARMHRGIDFGAASGTPIVAASDGQVIKSGWAGGYGRQVKISHGSGIVTSYSHMSRLVAEPGSFVKQGQLIGYVGSSGLSTGAHLHYEVYRNGVAVNPMGVKFAGQAQLSGSELDRFKARLASLMAIGNEQSRPSGG